MIGVSGVEKATHVICSIAVDDYVPLRFRSYEGTLGVKYLRFGDFQTSLLELMIDSNSLTIRGFTLTSFNFLHDPRAFGDLPVALGLPIAKISTEVSFQGPIGAQRIDFPEAFSVGFGAEIIEIDLGRLSDATGVVRNGQVEFYVGSESLVGIRVLGLNRAQLSTIQAQRTQ